MKAWERLINYVTVRTPSDEESETVPSSVCQFDLARKLEKEMKELGLTEVVLDDKCYLYGKLPATEGKKEIPALGFIAHMDTVSGTWHKRTGIESEGISTSDRAKRTYTAHFGWNNDSGSR